MKSKKKLSVPSVYQPVWDTIGSPIRFSLNVQDAFDGVSPADATLLWAVKSPGLFTPRRAPILIIRKGSIVFEGWETTTHPKSIYICVDSMSGYLDTYGNSTTKIALYELVEVIENS